MRYLLCAALTLSACGRSDSAREARATDSMAADTLATDTVGRMAPAPAGAMTPVPDRLLGSWTAVGYDAGSTRPQRFTMEWTRGPDGGLVGTIAFSPGETYKVKVVSTGDSTIVYQSEPHRSPTLKGEVVTRTTARIIGDSLAGTYEAKATAGGKVLRGRFGAKRGTTP